MAAECPTCGYDALETFAVYALTPSGVTSGATVMRCARCWMEGES